MTASINRRRWALFALFLLPGLSMSSWVTRTPAIRDMLGASTAEMGLVLFGISLGSMVGILSSGPLVTRLGGRIVVLFATTSVVVAMPVIGIGAALGTKLMVAIGLAMFGGGMGAADVAMNVEGAEVERITKRPFLPALHGCFSLGTVIGAVLGILANLTGFPVPLHLVLTGIVDAGLLVWAIGALPPATGKVSAAEKATQAAAGGTPIWRDPRLVLIGVIVLAVALAEGTANDWLPLIMVDGHGFSQTVGSVIFAIFALFMTVGRFSGGVAVRRFGRAAVLAASALSGAVGLALVAFVDNQVVAALAVVLWGLGASLGFPLAISAAGDSGPNPASRVAMVSIIGYVAFLVGPPVLGFVGEEVGLRGALVIPMVIVAIAAFLAPATKQPVPLESELQR